MSMRRVAPIYFAVLCSLALLACGDDDGVEASGTTATTTTGPGGSGSGGDGGSSTTTTSGGGMGGMVATGGGGVGGMGAGGSSDQQNDDFERQMLGGNWAVIFPQSPNDQVRIIGSSDLGMGAGPQGFFLVNWRGSTFGGDQFCEATIPLDVNPNWLHQVYVRWRSSDRARYGFGYAGDPNQSVYGNWIFKYDGVPTQQTRIVGQVLANAVTPPVAGDTLRVEIVGFELRGYKNGTLVMTATDTDSTKISSGETGLAARWANGNQSTNTDVKVWESWSGGSM
jgi:hypothetical protein